MALLLLCFMLLLAASAVLAKPKYPAEGLLSPTLDITSSHQLGHPLLGDTLGPFPPSVDVTLVCSSSDSLLVLSWWEGGGELESHDVNVGEQGTGRSIYLEALSVSDSGRHLTCKAKGADVEKTVLLEVAGTLDILVNEMSLGKDQVFIDVKSGDHLKLTCVLQGYNTPALSWFEGDTKLESQSDESSYAASTVLNVEGVSVADSGRRFSCRSEGGVLERVVEILVSGDEAIDKTEITADSNIEVLQIFLICICVGGILMIVVMVTVVVRLVRDYKEAVRCQQVSKVSEIFKKYSRLPNANGKSQNAFTPQLVRGPYKPCTILIDPEGSE